jgi:hypothetical protein
MPKRREVSATKGSHWSIGSAAEHHCTDVMLMFVGKRLARAYRQKREERHQVHSKSLPNTAELLIGPKYRPSKEATTFSFRRKVSPSVSGRKPKH